MHYYDPITPSTSSPVAENGIAETDPNVTSKNKISILKIVMT